IKGTDIFPMGRPLRMKTRKWGDFYRVSPATRISSDKVEGFISIWVSEGFRIARDTGYGRISHLPALPQEHCQSRFCPVGVPKSGPHA
ncbi:MAG: hypothetical protein ABGX07_23100, partial [Pirellulaceae bacterium]